MDYVLNPVPTMRLCLQQKMNNTQDLIVTGLKIHKVMEFAQVLSQAAALQGFDVKTAEFSVEQIMNVEMAHIRLGEKVFSPLIPEGKANIFVCFEPALAVKHIRKYLSPDGTIIMNTHSLLSFDATAEQLISLLSPSAKKVIKLDVFKMAEEAGDISRSHMVLLGILSGLPNAPVSLSNIIAVINKNFSSSDAKRYVKILESGREFIEKGGLNMYEGAYLNKDFRIEVDGKKKWQRLLRNLDKDKGNR